MVRCLGGRNTARLGAFSLAMALAAPQSAHAQLQCPNGRDPISLRCLPRPAKPPPPPPVVVIDSKPQALVFLLPGTANVGASGGCDPELQGLKRLGTTRLTLTQAQGLTRGKMAVCVFHSDYAAQELILDVPVSGELRKLVELVPLARTLIKWQCDYQLAPETVEASLDGGPLQRQALPLRLNLKPGTHQLQLTAEGFEPGSFEVVAGEPGSAELAQSICLRPTSRIELRNMPNEHPLDGLFVRATDGQGRLLWQGRAPRAGDSVQVPLRPDDSPVFSVFGDAGYVVPLPNESVVLTSEHGRTPDKAGAPGKSYWMRIELPKEPPPDRIDRAALQAACSNGDSFACLNEAYLQDREGLSINDVLARVCKAPAASHSPSAGAELGFGSVLLPKPHTRKETVQRIRECVVRPLTKEDLRLAERLAELGVLCTRSSSSEAWLACLRLAQPQLPAARFLTFSAADVPRLGSGFELYGTAGVDLMTAAVVRERGGGLAWLGLKLHVQVLRVFGVQIGIYPYSAAFFPAQAPDGSAAGTKWFGGGGLSLAYVIKPIEPLSIELGAFMVGYYTASASVAALSASLDWLVIRGETIEHHASLRAGYGRFPSVKLVGVDTRESQGAEWRPFIGLAYTAAFRLDE